jgi:hypothetical protein
MLFKHRYCCGWRDSQFYAVPGQCNVPNGLTGRQHRFRENASCKTETTNLQLQPLFCGPTRVSSCDDIMPFGMPCWANRDNRRCRGKRRNRGVVRVPVPDVMNENDRGVGGLRNECRISYHRRKPAVSASSKQQAASSKQQDRMSRRTAFRDTRNLRQVCLIGCPSWKYARRIFAIVSTTDMPELLSEVPRASWSPS